MIGGKLLIATGNRGKLAEFGEALSPFGFGVMSAADAGIKRFPPELGNTYVENALMKAAWAALKAGVPALADDSGIEVDALDGAPGVRSARFGGDLSDGERMALLLDRIRDVPEEERGASFVCSLVLATPAGGVEVFTGSVRGVILQGPRGERGFGYDPIFQSTELGVSFAEASLEDKRRVSHRGRAIRAFTAWLQSAEGEALMNGASTQR